MSQEIKKQEIPYPVSKITDILKPSRISSSLLLARLFLVTSLPFLVSCQMNQTPKGCPGTPAEVAYLIGGNPTKWIDTGKGSWQFSSQEGEFLNGPIKGRLETTHGGRLAFGDEPRYTTDAWYACINEDEFSRITPVITTSLTQ